jgi:pimeloyl-ACP methyl ester carboxylesterase
MFLEVAGGAKVYYDDVGTGAPALLIHGAAGSARAFDALTPHLAERFRVIRIDLRGLGRSDRVDAVSATAWCDDVIGLLDHLDLGQVHLAGCSLGARIAGRIALSHRERAATLTVDAPLVAVEASANTQLNTRFTNLDHPSAEDLARWQLFHGEDWRSAVSFYGRARNDASLQEYLTLRPHLPALDLPTLITRGDIDDNVHPLAHAIEWHRAQPASWLWVAPGTGFSLMQRQPGQFASIFTAFITTFAPSGTE